MTKRKPASVGGRFFSDDKQIQAHESATANAQDRAQDFSARVATEVAIAVRKVLSSYGDVSREKLVAEVGALVLKRAYASCYEYQYERSFDWELDSIIRDERRAKAEARKRAKEQERLAAWRREYAEMRDVNAVFDIERGQQ
jgi:hypothetical protein